VRCRQIEAGSQVSRYVKKDGDKYQEMRRKMEIRRSRTTNFGALVIDVGQ
jgi:hypothetical protein